MLTTRLVRCVLLVAIALCGVTACDSAPKTTRAGGPEAMRTLGYLDIDEAMQIAEEMTNSMVSRGPLGSTGQPSTIVESRFVNNTGQRNLDQDQVLQRIYAVLGQSKKAYVDLAAGGAGGRDPVAAQEKAVDTFLNNPQQRPQAPQDAYSMTFKIDRQVAAQKDVRQVTFTFYMTLAPLQGPRLGQAVWSDVKTVQKTGTGNAKNW